VFGWAGLPPTLMTRRRPRFRGTLTEARVEPIQWGPGHYIIYMVRVEEILAPPARGKQDFLRIGAALTCNIMVEGGRFYRGGSYWILRSIKMPERSRKRQQRKPPTAVIVRG